MLHILPSAVLGCGCSGELKAPWSTQVVKKPVVSVTDETGNKADVTLFNIWAGKVRLLRQPLHHNAQPCDSVTGSAAAADAPAAVVGVEC